VVQQHQVREYAQEVNIGTISTKGIDLASNYTLDIGPAGKLGFTLAGSRVLNFFTQPGGSAAGGAYDCVGTTAPLAMRRRRTGSMCSTTDWQAPWAGLDLFRWRYIGGRSTDRQSQDPQLSAGLLCAGASHIGGYSYFDMSASLPVASTGSASGWVSTTCRTRRPRSLRTATIRTVRIRRATTTPGWERTTRLGRYLYAHVSAKF
jgi:hypothetical protein